MIPTRYDRFVSALVRATRRLFLASDYREIEDYSLPSVLKYFSQLNETDPGLFHSDGRSRRATVSRYRKTDADFHRLPSKWSERNWFHVEGKISDLMIYDHPLTDEQVEELYRRAKDV